MAKRAAIALLLTGCVFPTDEPTGVELSWRFYEVNAVDGDEATRLRTCVGAGFDRIVFDIVHVGDEARSGNFDYPCEIGFQTPSEFRTEASDAFIELRPADYALSVDGVRSGTTQALIDLEVGVQGRGLTIEGLDLALGTGRWTLELVNTEVCAEVSFALRYPDPAEALAEPLLNEEGEAVDVEYRAGLVTDRGLSLGGAPGPCSAELAGPHIVDLIDQGPYRLAIVIDGLNCGANIEITPGDVSSVIDLANLACDG